MHDQPPRLIHTLRQTGSKNDHVDPPLNLRKHQAAHRRKSLALILFLLLNLFTRHTVLPSPLVQQYTLVRECVRALPRTHVGDGVGEVPTLEEAFVDKVAVVGPHERFADPALLEEGERFALVFEVGDGLEVP